MWNLFPWPGIEPGTPALGVWSLSQDHQESAQIWLLLAVSNSFFFCFVFNFLKKFLFLFYFIFLNFILFLNFT